MDSFQGHNLAAPVVGVERYAVGVLSREDARDDVIREERPGLPYLPDADNAQSATHRPQRLPDGAVCSTPRIVEGGLVPEAENAARNSSTLFSIPRDR